jgi:hypothetical protein
MLTKDDKDWLALLEGKEVLDADPNTLDEVEALKIALHTELQWQKLQVKMQTGKAKNESMYAQFKKLVLLWQNKILVNLRNFLKWKTLSLAVTYTFAVVVATLHFTPPIEITSSVETARSKSSSIQPDMCPIGSIVRLKFNPEQEALELKQQLESVGAEASYQKINDKE